MDATAKAPRSESAGGLPPGGPILLYDGVCGLCNRLVRFLIARDSSGRLRFAPLQGGLAAKALARHGRDPARLDTVYLITQPGTPAERVQSKSRAVLAAVAELGGAWRLAGALRIIPEPLRDAVYGFVARIRYRVFGRSDRCVLPPPGIRTRFLGLDPPKDP